MLLTKTDRDSDILFIYYIVLTGALMHIIY